MKHILLTLFLFGAACCYAQDVIKIAGSNPINCKILLVSKDEIVFAKDSIKRKANTAYVEYYKFNTTVKETPVKDSIPFVQTYTDSIPSVKTDSIPHKITPNLMQASAMGGYAAGDDLVNAGRHFRAGLTLSLLGSFAIAVSPLAITTKEVEKEIPYGSSTIKYKETEENYTGMAILMGAGVAMEVIGIVQMFVASNDLENAGNKMKNKQGLSINGSFQGFYIAYRF